LRKLRKYLCVTSSLRSRFWKETRSMASSSANCSTLRTSASLIGTTAVVDAKRWPLCTRRYPTTRVIGEQITQQFDIADRPRILLIPPYIRSRMRRAA
jgi:hypothetical protein